MPHDFRLPDLGEGVHEGQIVRLLIAEGDPVTEDQPLMEVETDKAAVEIPSPRSGMIVKWHVAEQQVVNVGDVMVTFDVDGDASTSGTETKTATRSATATTTAPAAPARPTVRRGSRTPASPAVRKLARTHGLNIETVTGSGPRGRVTRADIEAAAKGTTSPTGASPTRTASAPTRTSTAPLPPAVIEPPGTDDADAWGPTRREAMSQARKTIAANMTLSVTTIPHVTDTDEADVTDLNQIRKDHADAPDGRKITMLPFVLRAIARALPCFPEFNAMFDAERGEIVYRRYVNIAVGVHTERGLVAPVIRDIDRMGVLQIADALDRIADQARTASFAVNDTRGATYTVSNAGAYGGSRFSTPIISPGQCAVLALGRSRQRAWVVDGNVVPRLIMPLCHSFDHRIVDGGREIQFMRMIIDMLEHPGRLLL